MKRWRLHFKSKAGDQFVTLMARDKAEAEILGAAYQARRAGRYEITMQRLESGGGNFARLEPKAKALEAQRRKRDFSRYDIVLQEDSGAKDEQGKPVMVEKVYAAEAPLKLHSVEEVK